MVHFRMKVTIFITIVLKVNRKPQPHLSFSAHCFKNSEKDPKKASKRPNFSRKKHNMIGAVANQYPISVRMIMSIYT